MTTAIWQNKSILKTSKLYKKPNNIKNQPKGMSFSDWQAEVAEWKLNKLIILDKVPKTSRKEVVDRNEQE
jgi:hypothetical protein